MKRKTEESMIAYFKRVMDKSECSDPTRKVIAALSEAYMSVNDRKMGKQGTLKAFGPIEPSSPRYLMWLMQYIMHPISAGGIAWMGAFVGVALAFGAIVTRVWGGLRDGHVIMVAIITICLGAGAYVFMQLRFNKLIRAAIEPYENYLHRWWQAVQLVDDLFDGGLTCDDDKRFIPEAHMHTVAHECLTRWATYVVYVEMRDQNKLGVSSLDARCQLAREKFRTYHGLFFAVGLAEEKYDGYYTKAWEKISEWRDDPGVPLPDSTQMAEWIKRREEVIGRALFEEPRSFSLVE